VTENVGVRDAEGVVLLDDVWVGDGDGVAEGKTMNPTGGAFVLAVVP
jgi:hypothetical protein